MTRTRIHNLSISLDGFATGEGQRADAPMGHAGKRLHETHFGVGLPERSQVRHLPAFAAGPLERCTKRLGFLRRCRHPPVRRRDPHHLS